MSTSTKPHPSRDELLAILRECAEQQGVIQAKVTGLVRKLANDESVTNLSVVESRQKVLELDLPSHPLELRGLTEQMFNEFLAPYAEDEEVVAATEKMLRPLGSGDPERAKDIS